MPCSCRAVTRAGMCSRRAAVLAVASAVAVVVEAIAVEAFTVEASAAESVNASTPIVLWDESTGANVSRKSLPVILDLRLGR